MLKKQLSTKHAVLAAAAALLLFAAALLGVAGLLSVAAIMLLFVAVPYALLRVLPLEHDEALFFSLFIGIGVFPNLVWALGRVIPSLRFSLLLSLVLILIIAFLLHKRFRK